MTSVDIGKNYNKLIFTFNSISISSLISEIETFYATEGSDKNIIKFSNNYAIHIYRYYYGSNTYAYEIKLEKYTDSSYVTIEAQKDVIFSVLNIGGRPFYTGMSYAYDAPEDLGSVTDVVDTNLSSYIIGSITNDCAYYSDNDTLTKLKTLNHTTNTYCVVDSIDTIHIRNYNDLKQFSISVNNGNTYEGKRVVLDADIQITDNSDFPLIGYSTSAVRYFSGIFDGNGHTITMNQSSAKYVSTLPSSCGLRFLLLQQRNNKKIKSSS